MAAQQVGNKVRCSRLSITHQTTYRDGNRAHTLERVQVPVQLLADHHRQGVAVVPALNVPRIQTMQARRPLLQGVLERPVHLPGCATELVDLLGEPCALRGGVAAQAHQWQAHGGRVDALCEDAHHAGTHGQVVHKARL